MRLRPLALLALIVLVTLISARSVEAIAATPMPAVKAPAQALYPEDITHPVDLDTFSFTLTRKLTGAGAKRLHDFYTAEWDSVYPGLVAPRANNAPFVIEWVGEYENPGKFAEAMRINGGQKIYEEWFDGDDGRTRFSDGGLKFSTGRDMEALYWWDRFADWLEYNGAAVACGTATRLINDEQAVRCNAPNLSREARVGLIDAAGLQGGGYSATVNRLSFELWITKTDSVPLRLSIAAEGEDEYGDAFAGSFELNFEELDSDDIYIVLPRS